MEHDSAAAQRTLAPWVFADGIAGLAARWGVSKLEAQLLICEHLQEGLALVARWTRGIFCARQERTRFGDAVESLEQLADRRGLSHRPERQEAVEIQEEIARRKEEAAREREEKLGRGSRDGRVRHVFH